MNPGNAGSELFVAGFNDPGGKPLALMSEIARPDG